LTDEISKLTRENTRTLLVSCLTGIIANLASAQDVKGAIEKAMTSLGAILKEMVRTNVGARAFVAPCTPRNVQDFSTHANFAMVPDKIVFNLYQRFELLTFMTYLIS
jgi:hypothetical protein